MVIEGQERDTDTSKATNRFVKDKALAFLTITGLKENYNLIDGQVVINVSDGGITQVEVTKKHKRIIFR